VGAFGEAVHKEGKSHPRDVTAVVNAAMEPPPHTIRAVPPAVGIAPATSPGDASAAGGGAANKKRGSAARTIPDHNADGDFTIAMLQH
jgi:hypothetical protein